MSALLKPRYCRDWRVSNANLPTLKVAGFERAHRGWV